MFSDLFDSPWKILIIAVFFIVLFGARKLPDAARSVGKSMRILKTEIQGLHEDEEATTSSPVQAVPAPIPAPLQATAPVATTDSQAQIDALSKQLADLQQSVAVNTASANNVTDS